MCGICGIYGIKNAGELTFLALYALQHRGEESAGIASFDGKHIHQHKGPGHVREIFTSSAIKRLKGHLALGHTRYSTTGSGIAENIQPILARHRSTPVSIAHNGNLTNTSVLRHKLEKEGALFHGSTDSEILLHLLARARDKSLEAKLISALQSLEGAFSLVMMIGNTLVGARDTYGFRPLSLGRLDGGYIICSETCALDLIGARYVRDIEPGEIVIINEQGLRSLSLSEGRKRASCIFEYIYFARPDSRVFGKNVYQVRTALGRALAGEQPSDSDLVMPFPDSGTYAALGYSRESGIPLEMGVIRNHYVGRTFIQPSSEIRSLGVRVKLNPVRDILAGKRVTVVDDSIVRGTTSKSRVSLIREAGAREVHMRISAPPIIAPCFYGVDFPTRKELIAASKSVEEIKRFLGLDSLGYLSLEAMLDSVCRDKCGFCTACFTGEYPTKVPKNFRKTRWEGVV